MVEAVILLPVLAVLLSGLFFVHAHAAGRESARAAARRCAWLHAVAGCTEVPPGCDGFLQASQSARGAAEADAVVTEIKTQALENTSLDRIPVLDPALDGLFGTRTEFTVTRSVERGGFGGTAGGRMHLLCNARPLDPWEAVEETFCSQAKALCP